MKITEQEQALVSHAEKAGQFQTSDPALLLSLGVSQRRLNQIVCSAKKKGILVSKKKVIGSGLSKTNLVFWSIPKSITKSTK